MDCASKGIVSGYAEGDFRPTATVTRAHFTVMLSRAFYPAKTEANASIKEFGWFVPNAVALDEADILKNTAFQSGYTAATTMNQPISRYDMAQLMTNIMNAKGFSASEGQKFQVQYDIPDYSAVPGQYRDAVANVYALGIITGYADGSFNGSGNMTRGAGATVIYRMMKYAPEDDNSGVKVPDVETPAVPEPDIPSKPNPAPTGNSVITVSSRPDVWGTAWVVGDNNYPTGYLNNGDPVTEENVIKLIQCAKTQWPQDMSWSGGKDTNVFAYNNAVHTNGIQLKYNTNMSRGCGGFAALISNYVFGQTNNPIRKLTDNSQARPGDIVIMFNKKTNIVQHSFILTGRGNHPYTGAAGLTSAEGNFVENGRGIVNWDAGTCITKEFVQGNSTTYYEVWTRYPD